MRFKGKIVKVEPTENDLVNHITVNAKSEVGPLHYSFYFDAPNVEEFQLGKSIILEIGIDGIDGPLKTRSKIEE